MRFLDIANGSATLELDFTDLAILAEASRQMCFDTQKDAPKDAFLQAFGSACEAAHLALWTQGAMTLDAAHRHTLTDLRLALQSGNPAPR